MLAKQRRFVGPGRQAAKDKLVESGVPVSKIGFQLASCDDAECRCRVYSARRRGRWYVNGWLLSGPLIFVRSGVLHMRFSNMQAS